MSDQATFRILRDEDVDDRLELHLSPEVLRTVEGMVREFVPGLARYAWLIAADGLAWVVEGAPPSELTYRMRCLASTSCDEGEAVSGFCIHSTPTLAPFDFRLHVQTLGPGSPSRS